MITATEVLGTTDVAGSQYRLDAPGMSGSHAEARVRHGRDPEGNSGSRRTGTGYALRQSYSVLEVAFNSSYPVADRTTPTSCTLGTSAILAAGRNPCLLYTSDAADERSSVD